MFPRGGSFTVSGFLSLTLCLLFLSFLSFYSLLSAFPGFLASLRLSFCSADLIEISFRFYLSIYFATFFCFPTEPCSLSILSLFCRPKTCPGDEARYCVTPGVGKGQRMLCFLRMCASLCCVRCDLCFRNGKKKIEKESTMDTSGTCAYRLVRQQNNKKSYVLFFSILYPGLSLFSVEGRTFLFFSFLLAKMRQYCYTDMACWDCVVHLLFFIKIQDLFHQVVDLSNSNYVFGILDFLGNST